MWREEEKEDEGTAEEKVDGKDNFWRERGGPGGAERSGEESERVERWKMMTMTAARIKRINGTR